MSIADQITRLNNAKANIKQAIINKGVEVDDNALLDEYPALISSIPMEGGDPYYEEFYNLRTNNGTNMDSLFARTSGELDLRKVDVSNVTSMKYMFDNSSASVNIDGWDTSNVTDMSYMFYNFTGSIDISKLDTSKVTNASSMLGFVNTDNIILTGLSFPKCTKLDYMFTSASGTTLDLSSWDISNITSMYQMFNSASYKKIDLTGWKTTNVTDMYNMFNKYSNPLEELIIPDWDMTNVTSSSNFFGSSASYTKNLKLIDLSRSNDVTIIKIVSFLPTRTATTYGAVLVPENTSQEAYDALVAKYWRPIGAAMTPAPTSIDIVAELDEIMPGDSTKVYLGACEPWNADPSKVELVLASDSSIATIEGNIITSTGTIGEIVIEARIIDTQEVIGTKTIEVSETDSYPNVVKFRAASTPGEWVTSIVVNNNWVEGRHLTYDSIADIYSYDAGEPITYIDFMTDSNISELIKLNTSNMTNACSMFDGCEQLVSVNANSWDTSNITDMSHMFYYCTKLPALNINNWDVSKVTNMNNMFGCCYSLVELDLSNWDISKLTNDNGYMLYDCNALHTLRLDNCNNDTISKIISSAEFPTNAIDGVTRTIYCKEENAAGLTPPTNWVFSYVTEEEPEIPVEPSISLYVPGEFQGNWAITEVITMVNESHTDLNQMFSGCANLVSVNTEDWDTSNVTNMEEVFYYCTGLTSLDLSSFDTSNVTSIWNMFSYCTGLTTLDLSNFDISKVTWTGSIFYNCTSLHTLRLDNCSYDTINKIITSSDYPTNAIDGVTRTIYCKEAEAAGLTAPEGWVFSYVTEEEPEVPVDPPAGDIPLYVPGEFQGNMEITEVVTMVNESHDDLSEMFSNCFNLVSVNTEDWDTSNVTNTWSMFYNCKNLQSLDLSSWDTHNMTSIEQIFNGCSALTELDISGWNTSNITNMFGVFCSCSSLQSLNLSNWDVSNAIHMGNMFGYCRALQSLDLSNWSISGTCDTYAMFDECTALHTLRLDNCSNATISMIITGYGFPKGSIDGVIRTIYCKESEAVGLTPPTNWVFSYVD